jgi:archaemetzincin
MGTRLMVLCLIALCGLAVCYAQRDTAQPDPARRLREVMEKLRPLHTKLGKPQPGDWLTVHNEPGQTFREYLDSKPVHARGKRRVIHIQPLGTFTKHQRAIIDATSDFLGRYFQLPVTVKDTWPESVVPAHARRRHPSWGMEQILTGYVLDRLLLPKLPDDAAAFLAFTATDLWPGEGWNFVFGQASISNRVGVWSIYRNGDPSGGDDAFRLWLLRTMKTASHETGHMLSMLHCTLYECNMCGSNNREESDRRPLALCPECLAKLCWATGCDPEQRYRQLAAFCKQHRMSSERDFYERSMRALTGG